jgi:hypothetical protein
MTDAPTVHLQRLCCYIARQTARAGRPCVLTSDFRHFGPDADDVRTAAQANGLIRPVSRVKSHKGTVTVWGLTPAGLSLAQSAPPAVKAWRLAPPKAEVRA